MIQKFLYAKKYLFSNIFENLRIKTLNINKVFFLTFGNKVFKTNVCGMHFYP